MAAAKQARRGTNMPVDGGVRNNPLTITPHAPARKPKMMQQGPVWLHVCVCPTSPEVRQWRSTFFLGVAGLRVSSPHLAQAQRSKTARATRARTSIYPATRTWCAASWSCAHSRGNRSNWPYRGLSRSPRWPVTQAGSTQRTPAGWRSRSRQLFQMEGACTCTSRTQAAKKRWPCPLLRVAAAQ